MFIGVPGLKWHIAKFAHTRRRAKVGCITSKRRWIVISALPSSAPAKLLTLFARPDTVVEQGLHSTMGGKFTYQTIYE